ncbi:MAG: DUF4625 domain-containing protein [Bacteroidales bacterium]
MKPIGILFLLTSLIAVLTSCDPDTDIDSEKPTIDLTYPETFPLNGDTLYFGSTATIKLRLQDNNQLGSTRSLSIDMHHNFDHHSHSTEVDESNLDTAKSPVNPYVFIQSYDLPPNLNSYDTEIQINLPKQNEAGLYDSGDYHFFISLTDAQGWSTQKGLSIKIVHR